eukprot:Nitzschia sp. Nitz4//scaffold382_size14485//10635//11480//NITZ4_008938-RA/size14485-processed-gene-0.8-mRNA-1//1//CDS//3329549923//7853//frame0
MTSATSSHYQGHSAESYEQAYFYEAGAYQQYLVDLVRERLCLTPSTSKRHVLDIGGGTGNFAQALMEGMDGCEITVVDPFLDPTHMEPSSTEANQGLGFVKETAEVFLKPPQDSTMEPWRTHFHQVLLKEVAHHLLAKDRVGIFQGMRQEAKRLSVPSDQPNPPAVLIITRPQIEIDYPLWDAARTVWKNNQPSAQEFETELKQAGFIDVQTTLEAYPCQIQWTRWQEMVKNRFWSTFSNFSDQELQEACQVMTQEYAERIDADGKIHFEDRLVFVSASLP